MNLCEEISQRLKKQNVLILEKSVVQNNKQASGPQIGAFMSNKGQQIIRENLSFPVEKCFGLNNPYYEFCLKSNNLNNDTHLKSNRNSQNFCKEVYSSCKGEERRAPIPLEIIKIRSEFLEENLRNGIENKAINTCDEGCDLVQNNLLESIQLLKSTEEKVVPKKRRHEDGEDVAFLFEESVATKKVLFKTEKELCMENPYLEFILKSEDSNSRLSVTGNSEEFHTNSLASERESKMDEKSNKKVDIFGNHLTSKDRNKMKVNCPHCTKKVPAPGFVRHLSYCMSVRIRKSKRRN